MISRKHDWVEFLDLIDLIKDAAGIMGIGPRLDEEMSFRENLVQFI